MIWSLVITYVTLMVIRRPKVRAARAGAEGEQDLLQLRGLVVDDFMKAEPRFQKCERPLNKVPESNDAEGEPRMGKWYASRALGEDWR